ncbi:MAG: MAPEG family protein [Hyphomicrobium sp.]|nr:MAPEG family protein [Hyphomicrobium sp.]
MMPITALYAALLAPLFIFLSIRVIGLRRSARVALGPGEDRRLLRAMRVHANFAEYAPFALLLLALAESLALPVWLLHGAGAALVLGRAVHAYGVSQEPEQINIRVTGMVLTFTVIGTLAASCLIGALTRIAVV